MKSAAFNLSFVAAVTAGLFTLYTWGPHGLYSFHGHGRELRWALIGLYWSLSLTHVMFAVITWTQRKQWDLSEASIFRFVMTKAILWGFLALTARMLYGIPLAYFYMLIVIEATTIDLNIQMARRYLVRREDDRIDIRQGNPAGTARGDRAQRKELS